MNAPIKRNKQDLIEEVFQSYLDEASNNDAENFLCGALESLDAINIISHAGGDDYEEVGRAVCELIKRKLVEYNVSEEVFEHVYENNGEYVHAETFSYPYFELEAVA
jgi:hypothetical protein